MLYHWIEWDMWDNRTKRYAILEKEIIFEKNKKNNSILIIQAKSSMIDSMKKDIQKWEQNKGVYPKDTLWKPEIKVLDEVTSRSKIFEIIGNNGQHISFGHTIFEMKFSVKLSG